MNLQLEENWLHDKRILCYTLYSLNNMILKDWAVDILDKITHWPTEETPRLLFDVSNPNVSMSYFVLTRRNIFNLALTSETQPGLDAFIQAHPDVRVRLGLILSKTMVGVMSSGRGTNILRQLTVGKVFFEREAALTWLLADMHYEPDVRTRHMDLEPSLQELAIDSLASGIYPHSSELRLLVNGSLEIVPLTEERPIIIGRSPSADVDVTSHGHPAITVSRQHAQISVVNNELTILDLNSKNGTYINDERLISGKAVRIGHNDEIRVGVIKVRVLS